MRGAALHLLLTGALRGEQRDGNLPAVNHFIGIELSSQAKSAVETAIARGRALIDAKWVHSEHAHLTVVFLGPADAALLEQAQQVMSAVARRHRPFNLTIEGAGTFEHRGVPGVLWLGVGGDRAALNAIEGELRAGLSRPTEHNEYRPHITLARAKGRRGEISLSNVVGAVQPAEAVPLRVEALTLFEGLGAGLYRSRARMLLSRSD